MIKQEPVGPAPCARLSASRAQRPSGPMEIRLTLRPGMSGTKKLLARYGERLVCVRYRYDRATGRRVKTAELIVEDVARAAATTTTSSAFGSAGKRANCARQSSARAASGGHDSGCESSPGTQSALRACTAGSSSNFPGKKLEPEYIAAYGAVYR